MDMDTTGDDLDVFILIQHGCHFTCFMIHSRNIHFLHVIEIDKYVFFQDIYKL